MAISRGILDSSSWVTMVTSFDSDGNVWASSTLISLLKLILADRLYSVHTGLTLTIVFVSAQVRPAVTRCYRPGQCGHMSVTFTTMSNGTYNDAVGNVMRGRPNKSIA